MKNIKSAIRLRLTRVSLALSAVRDMISVMPIITKEEGSEVDETRAMEKRSVNMIFALASTLW